MCSFVQILMVFTFALHILFVNLALGTSFLSVLGYFKRKGDYTPQKFFIPRELLSLSGNIVLQDDEYIFHVHAILGDEKKNTIGGHLLDGTVSITNEIVLLKEDLDIKRVKDEETGLMGIQID